MTLKLAETSVLKSRPSVPYGANLCYNTAAAAATGTGVVVVVVSGIVEWSRGRGRSDGV